ncbi:MAG: hypothetical protein ACI837_001807 [Crocinitomicaceae bacterium]|jgi:hypothetical protein
MNLFLTLKRTPTCSLLFQRKMLLIPLLSICTCLINNPLNAQDCQSSYDHEDTYGEDFPLHREFRCGTSMMQDQEHHERMEREKKGFYDIEGASFYGSNGYYKKGDKLYYSSDQDTFNLVAGGDAASLEIVGNFIRDVNYVYSNGKAQKIVNAKAFLALPYTPYAMDGSHVYYSAARGGFGSAEEIQVIEGADPKTFGTLCDKNSNGSCYSYGKDNVHAYYSGIQIEDADATTFRIEEMGYARDSQFVYYNGQKLEGSDGESYEMVDYYYMRDKNNVYTHGQIVPEMDGSKFKLIGLSGMGTDGVRICYRTEVFENSDASTFADLGCGYYKDANNVYSKGQILEDVDSESFEILMWGFTKDKNRVYCDSEVIPGAKPSSFEVLGRKYSRDEKIVFYLRSTLPNANRDSFVVDSADHNNGTDSKATYYRGKRTKK